MVEAVTKILQIFGFSELCGLLNLCYKLEIYFKKFFLILFIYFWLCWVFVAVRGLSLVAVSGGYSSLRFARFSLRWLLLLRSTGSRCVGFSSFGTWAQQLWLTGSVVVAHRPQSTSSVVVANGLSCSVARGIFPDQESNLCPCIGRRILNHCTTREVLNILFDLNEFVFQKGQKTVYKNAPK